MPAAVPLPETLSPDPALAAVNDEPVSTHLPHSLPPEHSQAMLKRIPATATAPAPAQIQAAVPVTASAPPQEPALGPVTGLSPVVGVVSPSQPQLSAPTQVPAPSVVANQLPAAAAPGEVPPAAPANQLPANSEALNKSAPNTAPRWSAPREPAKLQYTGPLGYRAERLNDFAYNRYRLRPKSAQVFISEGTRADFVPKLKEYLLGAGLKVLPYDPAFAYLPHEVLLVERTEQPLQGTVGYLDEGRRSIWQLLQRQFPEKCGKAAQ
ncbi:MAG: hypothetical protein IJ228_06600 [Succinivibrio sp.]|nr:hypothetical protein [Succinivibrio sp.]